MYILDTDIISYSLFHPENYKYLIHNIQTVSKRDQYISVITAQELIGFRLQAVVQSKNQRYPQIVRAYFYLFEIIKDVNQMQILPFDEQAYRKFENIPAKVKGNVNDKRIASIALSHDFTLVTNNIDHFKGIDGLRIADWIAKPLR